jgi:hypothetical protein
METCKICQEKFKNLKGLTTHVNSKHNLTGREYYDEYLKKKGEGKCVVCGNETTYRNVGIGYLVNCSIECRSKNKSIKRDHWVGKSQSKIHIEKRIKNTNQVKKESNRKKTMLDNYGVDNPSKLDYVKTIISEKLTGKKQNRSVDWQNKIINSKRKNGTLKHSDETKSKIVDSLNTYHSLNLDREKYMSKSNNINHFCGWYNGLYFRSSLELSFLFLNKEISFISCEKNKYKIIYEKDGKQKVYYPDYTDGDIIYEIKPNNLLEYKDNNLKINKGLELYGDKYKVITENETPYLEKNKILELIETGVVIVNKKSLKILEKYKY